MSKQEAFLFNSELVDFVISTIHVALAAYLLYKLWHVGLEQMYLHKHCLCISIIAEA